MKDKFLTAKNCQRCGKELTTRIMSWFTTEVICIDCSLDEDQVKKKLRLNGKDPATYEGCGYIPEV